MDASAFANHGAIMTRAHNLSIKVEPGVPLLVPRQGDDFRGPTDDFEFPSEADQCDFEGEFAVITDDIPMGASPAQARAGIKLVTMLNDISARAYVFKEIGIGFGVIRGKPATIFAPVAVTPDELGPAWQDTRIHLDMHVSRNGEWFGHPNGADMAFGFDEILSYMAYNRRLRAGTVLGSGTLSDSNYQEVGSACLAERRALDLLAGRALTPWIGFGERMRIDAKDALGASMFGAIDFKFVASSPAA